MAIDNTLDQGEEERVLTVKDFTNPALDEKRSFGYEDRKRMAIVYGHALGKLPGGMAFMQLFHAGMKLMYVFLRLLGRIPGLGDRVDRWIGESEEMFGIYYAAIRGDL